MNLITIHGRLTRDPETRTAGNGTVARFTVAANRSYDRDTADFFDCDAWGKTGEFVQQYFNKGQEIIVTGEMQSRKYDDKDGNKRTAWAVRVDRVVFCGSKADKSAVTSHTEASGADIGAEPVPEKPLPF